MRKYLGGLTAALAALGVGASTAGAAPVVTQAAGPNAAAITSAVDQFSNNLGTLNGGGDPAPSGRRQIVWDGVPDNRSAPFFMPEGQFRGVGGLFSTPGTGFQVSGNVTLDFAEINATYATAFQAFSAPRLFAPIGSNITNTTFVVPASDTAAQTNGFGVVFSDVDQAGTQIELIEADGDSLGVFPVPAAGNGNATFSFLGVSFDAGERIATARITTGGAPLAGPAPTGNDVTQGGPADIVVMDNFIYGEPQAIPPNAAPTVRIQGAPRAIRLRRLVRRGLRLRLTPNEAASFSASLLASVRGVSIARNELTLARRNLGLASGARTLRLRPKRRFLSNTPRRFRLQLAVTATDSSGQSRTFRRTIRVRR